MEICLKFNGLHAILFQNIRCSCLGCSLRLSSQSHICFTSVTAQSQSQSTVIMLKFSLQSQMSFVLIDS